MDDIAIVGLSFRLPQEAEDEASFWGVLEGQKNLRTKWPESRLRSEAFLDPRSGSRNKFKSREAHFLRQDPAAFDAPFFSITASEAAAMDPQHRLSLETAYHAFENAGIPVESLRGSHISVYAASFTDDYTRMLAKDPDQYPRTTILGTAPSILPNRLSWYFDLSGPSMHVDTACSSSLVALDLACQSLRNGEAAMALVVGTNLILGPEASVLLANGNFLSPDSVCYSFDHRANGYARGEGIVCMLIKPVSEAVRDGNMIRAVLRSIGSNQDGRTPVISQPSAMRQENLIRQVYRKAGLDFAPTRYIEAHGTGTHVGDPIEMEAIGRVFGPYRSASEPLYVGSVKANIGHLEGSAGLAGVLKALLVLERGAIPPNALFERLNPSIDADFYHIVVPTKLVAWPGRGMRRVSVNSFGFGGTNSHAVIDDAFYYLQARCLNGLHHTTLLPPLTRNGNCSIDGRLSDDHAVKGCTTKAPATAGVHVPCSGLDGDNETTPLATHLLVFSAPDENSLRRVTEGYKTFFEENIRGSTSSLGQLAFTLAARRSHKLWRSYAVVHTNATGETPLEGLGIAKYARASTSCNIAFVLSGQGAQYTRMGLGLLRYDVFRETLGEVDKALHGLGCTWSVLDQLGSNHTIHKPEYSQPLCTALQIALLELLRSYGVVPTAVIGHSSGEIAAAYSAGALSLASACKVAYLRGQLAGKLRDTVSPGAMISANLAPDKVQKYLEEKVPEWSSFITVACMNSPVNSTLSGPEEAIDVIQLQFDRDDIFAKKLNTGIAYHSPSMQAITFEYVEEMGQLESRIMYDDNINIPTVFSSVTGQIAQTELLATPQYWAENLVSPVRFSDALRALIQAQTPAISDLVEVGPHHVLRQPIRDTLMMESSRPADMIHYHNTLERSKEACLAILELTGGLFCKGYPVSIQAANKQLPLSDGAAAIPFRIDCPSFPFDHSRTYWAEPRLSRDFRLRKPVPKSSLGARYYHWNPLEPIWRQILCVENIPWVKDHEITGRIIYPGAGMLIMTLEAAKQMCPEGRKLSGLCIKEAHFLSAIMVNTEWEGSTEAFLQLRPKRQAHEKQAVWFEAKITTQANGEWTECFSATVRTEFEDEEMTQVDAGTEARLVREELASKAQLTDEACTRSLDHHDFYSCYHEAGLCYGDSFQLLEDIRWDGINTATACIDMISAKHQIDSLVHPAVLDCALHLTGAPASNGLSNPIPTCVPSKIHDAWFSPRKSCWQSPKTSRLRCTATQMALPDARGTATSTIHIFDDDGSPLCVIGRLIMAQVSTSLDDRPDVASKHKMKLLHGVRWKPQLSLLSPEQLQHAFDVPKNDVSMEKYRELLDGTLEDVLYMISRRLSVDQRQHVPDSLTRYVSWMDQKAEQRRALLSQRLEGSRDEPEANDVEARLEMAKDTCPSWEIYHAVAHNLEGILVGQVDPLQVAFGTGLAERFYIDLFDRTCDERFRKLLNLMAHENPCMRILEVGAGTGTMTEHILSCLGDQRDGGIKFIEYAYTDISPAFFDKARSRFHQFSDRMQLKTFDLERDATEQGFKMAAYDVVFAGSVIHVAADLNAALTNIRSLLRPGGQLVMSEIVAPESVVTNFAFGVLPGWSRSSEPWRRLSPAISEQRWDDILRQSGFTGIDLVLRDYPSDACHIASILVSTASWSSESRPSNVTLSRHLYLVVMTDLDVARFGITVRSLQELPGWDVRCLCLDRVQETEFTEDDVVISLVDIETPFIVNMTEPHFQFLKALINRTCNLLWVAVANLNDSQYPHYSLMQGFLRSMRSENIDKQIVSLSIESGPSSHDYISHVLAVFRTAFASPFPSPELEYRVLNGQLLTARAFEEQPLNARINSLISAEPRCQAWQDIPPAKLSVGSPGCLDTLSFIEDSIYKTDLNSNEVEIEARAWGLSFRDVFVGLGRLTGDDDMGYDCAGVVTRVGPGCDGNIKVGDRVCGVSLGCMRAFPRAQFVTVAKFPDTFSFEQAASVIAPGITAYYSFIQIGRLRKGEKVLIHSASGSTGQMAIQVAKSVGAEIFATVGYDDKKQLLIDQFGLPADHIFYSRNASFAQGVLRVTKGYGVDVVLNSLSGDGLRASWECMAPYGRFVEIGKADITSNSGLPMAGFSRNVSFTAVDLHHAAQSNPGLIGELVQKTLGLVCSQVLSCPSPLHIYPVSDVELAFRYLQSGRNTGRIVIKVDHKDVVPTRIRETSHWVFDSGASYIVCGGLGGLGREIVRWMATKGARNLILPSRSGLRTRPAAARTVLELQQRGVRVITPICDVSSVPDLAGMLKDCARAGMPRTKGCINAAMVLQDAVFDNMTYTQWDLTVRSKVWSSWNLHQALPADLDFFILLSSLAGINGSVAQSNYAAGCAFQDALARFRTANKCGRRNIALDLGWMHNIGIIAETAAYQHVRETADDMAQIEDVQLLALLDMCCDPAGPLEVQDEDRTQLLVGVVTPADRLAEGKTPPPLTQRPLFAGFSAVAGPDDGNGSSNGTTTANIDYAAMFREAVLDGESSSTNIAEHKLSPSQIVVRALAERLAHALGLAAEDVEPSKRLDDYGVDSLVAVEMRNWITKSFAATVAVFEIMGGTSIAAIGNLVVRRSEIGGGGKEIREGDK